MVQNGKFPNIRLRKAAVGQTDSRGAGAHTADPQPRWRRAPSVTHAHQEDGRSHQSRIAPRTCAQTQTHAQTRGLNAHVGADLLRDHETLLAGVLVTTPSAQRLGHVIVLQVVVAMDGQQSGRHGGQEEKQKNKHDETFTSR